MNKQFSKKKSFLTIILVFAIILTTISGAISFVKNSDTKQQTYITICGKDFTFPEYEVFYVLYINEFVDKYALYLDTWGLDVNKDFSKQQLDENYTWEEAFKLQVEEDMKQYVVLNDDIKATNTKVDVSSQVDDLISIFENNAKTSGTTLENYINALFGENVTENDVRKAVEYKYSAIEYSNILAQKFADEVTEKDLLDIYTDYPATFDKITYRIVEFTPEEGEDLETSSAHDKAHSFEEAITDEDSFIEAAKEITDEDTLKTDIGTSSLDNDSLISWLYDEERKLGDKTIIEADDAFYVVFFKSRNICEDATVDFRHIYFNTQNASSQEKEEIKEKAQDVYSKLMDSDKSLAFIYSDDSTTSSNGGLMEGMTTSSVSKELTSWLFEDERKPGDINFIETSLGYHIVYFEKKGEVYWKVAAKDYLSSKAYDDYVNKLLSKYDTTDAIKTDDITDTEE